MKGALIEFDGGTGKRPDIVEDIRDIGACTVSQERCLAHGSAVSETTKCFQSGLSNAEWSQEWRESKEEREHPLTHQRLRQRVGSNHYKFQTRWQQLATRPCLEITIFEEDWDTDLFEGQAGVTVLHDDEEIQAAIDEHCKPYYKVDNELYFQIDIAQRGIKLADVPGTSDEVTKALHEMGVKGISERRRPTLVDMYGPKATRKARGYKVE